MFNRQLSRVTGRSRRTLYCITSDGVWVRGKLHFVAAHLPRSHPIFVRRIGVKNLRDITTDLANIPELACSLYDMSIMRDFGIIFVDRIDRN
jgi:hypothetical protein